MKETGLIQVDEVEEGEEIGKCQKHYSAQVANG